MALEINGVSLGVIYFTHFTKFSPRKKWSYGNCGLLHPEINGVIMGPYVLTGFWEPTW